MTTDIDSLLRRYFPARLSPPAKPEKEEFQWPALPESVTARFLDSIREFEESQALQAKQRRFKHLYGKVEARDFREDHGNRFERAWLDEITDDKVADAILLIPRHFALSGQTVWEVRPLNGIDTSGGFFVAGASGTDYSQQNSPQYALTGLTTAAANAIILTASASADMVGNGIQITSGTNFTAGIYQITAVSVGVSMTLDRNCTTAAGALGVGNIGGALQTLSKLSGVMIGSNKAFVKAEATISLGSITFGAAAVAFSETTPITSLIGYTSTRSDNGQVSITATTAIPLRFSNVGWLVANFNVDCASQGSSRGIYCDGGSNGVFGGFIIRNCKVKNYTTQAMQIGAYPCSIHHCDVTLGLAGALGLGGTAFHTVIYCCYVHDNACPAVFFNLDVQGSMVLRCVIANNTGSTTDGINAVTGMFVLDNVIDNNGRHGIYLDGGPTIFMPNFLCRNNLLTNHSAAGAAGLKCSAAAMPANPMWDGNFYYNNTNNRVNFDDTTNNAINGVAPYTNFLDVVLSASPYTRVTSTATDLAIDASNNLKVTSGSYNFVAGDVGLTIQVFSGSGFIQGTYTIASISGTAAILSTSPGTTSSTGGKWYFNNYTLNTTAGGGAAVRGAGTPGVGGTVFSGIPGLPQSGNLDGGVFQHADPAAGAPLNVGVRTGGRL